MRKYLLLLVGIAFIGLWGCECYDCNECWWCDYTPPPVPYNVHSITRDGAVSLYWNPLNTCDLAGYRVYRGFAASGYYDLIGETRSACFMDRQVANGETYYYAISSYDWDGNESELSADLVYDTPRPEGYGVILWNHSEYPYDSGYDFSEYRVREWDYPSTDVYLVYNSGAFFLYPGNSMTDILDYGYVSTLDEVDWAPEDGWHSSPALLVAGHAYCVWTCDNHFAKIRLNLASYPQYVIFDWAYQTDTGNPELKARKTQPQDNIQGLTLTEQEDVLK
ncbi:hypothetical protein JW877_08145 [bacterium]|nr:hypothetical protein [bacterium]